MPRLGILVLVQGLTLDAARGRRIGLQPLRRDSDTAVYADPVIARLDPVLGGFDLTDFLYMPVDIGQIEIEQQIGNRFFLGIVDGGRELLIIRILRLEQFLADFLAQLPEAFLQALLAMLELVCRQF